MTPIVLAVGLAVALRFGLSLLGAAVATTGVPPPCHFEVARNGWRTLPELLADGPAFALVGVWERWDACWYLKIASHGYEPGEHAVAFFPLFPSAVRIVGALPGIAAPAAGMLVSLAAFVVASAGIMRLVEASHGRPVGRWTAILLAVFPAALFLVAPFTEALFLASAVWSIVLARTRRWPLAVLAGCMAGLTRPQGVLLAIPLAWEAWSAVREQPSGRVRSALVPVTAALAPIIAFTAFAAAGRAMTGETTFDAQALWGGTEFHPPWVVIAASATWIVERGDGLQALNLVALLGAAALLVAGARRMPLTYSLYAWPPLLLVATRLQPTPLTSTTRYVLVLFPVFVVAALLTERRPWLRALWVGVSLMLLAVMATWFVQGDFVA